MILNRMGNKTRVAKDIQKHFPAHSIYIEPFFGAGGMFFNKPKAKYNIMNDLDSDVFNLFNVVSTEIETLKDEYFKMPIHSDLFEYWKNNKETEPIKKALRFLLLSNFTFNGAGASLVFGASSSRATSYKNDFYKKLDDCNKLIFDVQFMNVDFRKFFNSIMLDDRSGERLKTLIYCDPPYLGTGDNYENSFKEMDSNDLFDCLQKSGCKWAMSEFNHPFILEQAKQRNLNVITIGERQNLKNRRTEILVTNYKNHATLFDF